MKMNRNSISANNFQSNACHLSESEAQLLPLPLPLPTEQQFCQFPLAVSKMAKKVMKKGFRWEGGLLYLPIELPAVD